MSGPVPDGSDRGPVHFDLAEASLEQYDAVLEHLRRQGHYHELDGSMLTVQARHADDVRTLLANPSRNQALTIPAYMPVRAAWTSFSGRWPNRRIAPRWARLAGAIIDGVVWAVVVGPAASAGRTAAVGATIAMSLLFVVMTGVAGATPGKFVVRTRVEGANGGAPGIPRSLVRWMVPSLPAALAAALAPVSEGAAAGTVALGTLAVYAGVLAHPEARGLHDMAAGTTVVRRGD